MNEVEQSGVRSYRSGSWFGIFGDHATVLLPASEKARVAALWELVDGGAGFDELLDALIASGLRSLPAFVLLSSNGDPMRIVLRGAARATFTVGSGEPVEVDGGSAATWVERTLSGVTAMQVELDDAETGADSAEAYRITAGLVRVGRVDQPPRGEESDRSAGGAHAALPDTAVSEDAADEDVTPEAPVAEPPVDSPEAAPEAPAVAAVVPPVAAPGDAPGDGPEPETPAHEQPSFEEPAASDETAGAEDALAAEEVPDVAPAPPEQPWDQQGNVYSPPEPPSSPFGQPAASQPPLDQPPAAPEAPAAPVWGDPAAAPMEDSDHDGHTMAGSVKPDQFARQHPGIPGQPPAPSVTAEPVARLVFSNGETVDVDRAVLIGRAPEARRFTATDQPRLVTVPSPNQEISSTHLEVRPGSGADHGSAIVTDMGSTNGTVLALPGLSPENLQPGIAVQLLPGSVIDLGDGVSIQVTNV